MLTINNFFIGTDIVEIERIKNSIDKYGLKFIEKIYTPREIKYCQNKKNCYPHFAARFAAKESIKKAIFSLYFSALCFNKYPTLNPDNCIISNK